MEKSGTIINGKLSDCCKTSVSINIGTNKKPFHYSCNNCRKDCQMIETPYWIITEKGKYKKI